MAASELQDRLDYLVSYASQLIFINSESIDQSGVLDTFISDSPEQIEIALLSATTTTPLLKYREKIYRQLVSQTQNADFNRPLNQLLAALNQHDGSLIISISRAENLPDKLLHELWELVLQSRFANNKQHLNVLLFAQGAWAKQARNKLQSRSGDKPLLLNDATGLPRLNQHSSSLDKLIAQKRQQFSERVKKRAETQTRTPSYLQKKGVIATFVGIFLLLFGGIVSLQYPFWSLSAEHANQVADIDQTSVTSPPSDAPVALDESLTLDNTVASLQATSDNLTVNAEMTEATPDESLPTASLNASSDRLITDWRSAVAKIDEKPSQYLLATPQAATIAPQTAEPVQSPDLPSETQRLVSSVTSAADSGTRQTAQNHSEIKPTTATVTDTLELRNGQYLIQISAMSDNYLLQQFMQQNPFSKQVWRYTTQRFGADWHVLIYKQYYSSLADARAALAQLPPELAHYRPFVKSARQIKQEIAQKGA